MSSTLLLPPREQLCNRSCSNKHTLSSDLSDTPWLNRRRPGSLYSSLNFLSPSPHANSFIIGTAVINNTRNDPSSSSSSSSSARYFSTLEVIFPGNVGIRKAQRRIQAGARRPGRRSLPEFPLFTPTRVSFEPGTSTSAVTLRILSRDFHLTSMTPGCVIRNFGRSS